MSTPRTSWFKTGRRFIAGAALGLTLAGSAFGQSVFTPVGDDNYREPRPATFELVPPATDDPTPDVASATDFGPAPDGYDRAGYSTGTYETRKPVLDRDNLWQNPPSRDIQGPSRDFQQPVAPQKAEPTADEKIDARLAARYGNPVVERFIKGTSPNRFADLYLETSRLIDSRHIEPSTYQARVDRAIQNLEHAVRLPEFQRVYGLNLSPAQQQAFLRDLDGYAAGQRVQSANDALRAMSGVASIAGRDIGLPPAAVGAEFVYGATESLDEYSAFNPEAPAARPSASTGLEDSVVGIGVEIKPADNGVLVLKALRNGPAEKAGVQSGDVITSINGQNVAGKSMDFAVDQIKGPQGSPVVLTVLRDGRTEQLSMRRETVRVYSVSDVEMIDPARKIGYIKLDKFAEASSAEMDEALWKLWNQGMQSLVLDLRGNPGGLLTTAIELSDKFLPGGTIVSTRGRTAEDNSQEVAHRPKTWKTPLVVLVDGNSASASEIFAAAIQENNRGVIVGRKSFGKGTVQTHFPLQTIAGNLKITTARFYSPKGRVMAHAGVTPDVLIPQTSDDPTAVPLAQDGDVQAALKVADGKEVREMAAASERGDNLMSQR